MNKKTSVIAILTMLMTLLGTVASSDVVQGFIGNLVATHPVLATVGTVLTVAGALLHAPNKPTPPTS